MDLLKEGAEFQETENKGCDTKLGGKIEFNHVVFSYPGRSDVEVLKDIHFKIETGQKVALVGASGAGKTTLTSLLFRFYDPSSGEILFDGQPSTSIHQKCLRQQMAIVPQEVQLFSGTILENIRFGKPSASTEEVIEAAKQANAWEFISSFPDQMETEVGDRGIQLSGGQKQRVAIARAILKNPTILILDEATSALDSESERLVQEALDKLMKNRTSIVIAHRLSTIQNADKIIVLQHGTIIETGNHHDLMKLNGVYADLVAMQTMRN